MLDPYRVLSPLLRSLDPERAHGLALWGLKCGLGSLVYQPGRDDPMLSQRLWGMTFPNPVGLAAGFDKNGDVIAPALRLGCGFVEIGAVTPRPQSGNPRPRLFRLQEDRAVINRLGFNSAGLAAVVPRLKGMNRLGRVGVNLGKNKESQDAAADYAAVARGVSADVDFLVINVSSPNTPGLRALQSVAPLIAILRAVRAARDEAKAVQPPAVLLKLSPDLDSDELKDIVAAAEGENVDGIVIGNTTITRPSTLASPLAAEAGGLSGPPLFALSTDVVRQVYALTKGRLPLVGVGGVSSAADAYAKIRAGASLVQIYTALVYEGPGLFARIKRELPELLKRDGFASVAAAVGADHRSGMSRS